jgi:hypothetical protein
MEQKEQKEQKESEDLSWFPSLYLLCHSEKEKKRFEFLQYHLPIRGIPQHKIKLVKGIWGDEITSDLYFKAYDPFYSRFGLEKPLTFKGAGLLKGEVSLVMTFMQGVLDACTQPEEWFLFLESDCILRKDFIPRLESILKDTSIESADYISLGEGVGTRPVDFLTSYYGPTKLYDPPTKCVFRCTDSMLLRKSFVLKLKQTLMPFRDCLDWELNLQIAIHNGKALWADPPLVEQGSGRSRNVSLLPA